MFSSKVGFSTDSSSEESQQMMQQDAISKPTTPVNKEAPQKIGQNMPQIAAPRFVGEFI